MRRQGKTGDYIRNCGIVKPPSKKSFSIMRLFRGFALFAITMAISAASIGQGVLPAGQTQGENGTQAGTPHAGISLNVLTSPTLD